MRPLTACLVVLGLAFLVGRADDTAPPKRSPMRDVFNDDASEPKGSITYGALKKEFTEAQAKQAKEEKQAQKGISEAKSDEAKQEAERKLREITKERPGPSYAVRFLEFAEKHPQDPMAFAAAMMAFKFSARPATKDNTLCKALVYLQDNYATKPEIKQLVRIFEESKGVAGEALLRQVLAKNPDHRIQGHACNALLAITTKAAEREHLHKLLKGKYVDLFPDISEGKPVPEIATKNLRGMNVKLSDLRGKVVVLDVWTTWCPHCRAMIPHQRAMVERLKDKPFALVSINMDANKETLTEFLAKEKMRWAHWWVGENSHLAEDWNIEYFPTIYVIDAKGVLRHTGLSGDELDEAVNELLKKIVQKKGK